MVILAAFALGLFGHEARGQTLATNTAITTNSSWSFFRGTNEASTPIDAWRFPGFNDASWQSLRAPFHYGTNSVGGDDNLTDGTILSDMQGNYSSVFLRQRFVVSNAYTVTSLQMHLNIDDGFVVWLNGAEIRRAFMTNALGGTPVYYTSPAASSHEATTSLIIGNVGTQTNLVEGTNYLCIQAFNYGNTNDDFRVDPDFLLVSAPPPLLTNIFPAPGADVSNLTQITVTFNQTVTNVDAADLRLNGQPAIAVSASAQTNVFTFTFLPPPTGPVQVSWDPAHGIQNVLRIPYLGAETWSYAHFTTPPLVQSVFPAAGSTVSNLNQVTVTFNQAVTNVDAGNLLLNGQPATLVSVNGNSYTFFFNNPPIGTSQITWSPEQNIRNTIGVVFEPGGVTWTFNTVLAVSSVTPSPGATLGAITEAQVVFNAPVIGVDASDLLVNGQPATSVVGSGAGPYVFAFAAPAVGLVQFSWAVATGIRDSAIPAHDFAGGGWTITLNPSVANGDIIINEFIAGNAVSNSVYDVDEDLDIQDWIELYNHGSNAVRLLGWSLTDTKELPGQWVFPDVTMAPGSYLLVYASAKDRTVVGGRNALGRTNQLHTNFKLNIFGEYLGLFNPDSPRKMMTEFNPQFPEQRNDYSYGLTASNGWRYFAVPTPMAANGNSAITQVVPEPHVNVSRGVFDQPFTAIVNCDITNATLIYTTNGSAPSLINGTVYTGPLVISNTTIFRVAAFATNMLPSRVSTHTYLFFDQVLKQPNNPPGYPSSWIATIGGTPGTFPADYEMDPEVVTNAAYANMVKPALAALPALSVAIKIEDMFSSTNGIYANPEPPDAQRYLWERGCSVEFMPTNGSSEDGFHVDCGIRVQGNASRTPNKTSKHPLRLLFRGDYGPGQLDYQLYPDSPIIAWDTVVLRADFNNSWCHWESAQRTRGTRLRDAWGKDTARAMGAVAGHSRYVNLFINGLYWGVYEFSERIDKTFAANYLRGNPDDFDVMASKPTEAIDGDRTAYDTMINNVRSKDMRVLTNYTAALGYVDMTNYVDYILLNFYAANQDWGFDGNWNAIRRRAPGALYQYCVWDAERYIEGTGDNRVSNTDVPSGLHTNLINSLEYKVFFGDRVQRHLFNNGALNSNQCILRLSSRVAQLDTAIVAESARWGDNRRDVTTTSGGGTAPFDLYTRNGYWLPEVNRLMSNYFIVRPATFLSQLRGAGLYPNVTAPTFSQHGGRVPAGFPLSITGATNVVYYTTNGADPRVYGSGAVSPFASSYFAAVAINSSMNIKARALSGTNWSALVDATFIVDSLIPAIRVTELMYNPIGGDAYEFIELQNAGATAIDLSLYSFTGITFSFPVGYMLNAGQRIVLGSSGNTNAFKLRYSGVAVAGWFDGKLSNGGEKITLLDKDLRTVLSIDFDHANGWAVAADGGGSSLELINLNGDPDDPANWQASSGQNGTPGAVNSPSPASAVVLNEVLAENVASFSTNGIYPDWVELYNSGLAATNIGGWSITDDGNPRRFVLPANTIIPGAGYLVIWFDTLTNAPGIHTGFGLSRSGESLYLFDSSSNRVDAVSFGGQVADYTIARFGSTWRLGQPTPGGANSAATLAPSSSLVINEWLANAAPGGNDWVELFNTSSNAPASLQNLYVGTSNALFQMRSLSFVPPRGYIQLIADEGGLGHLDLKLPATPGAIVLYDASGGELQRVPYGTQAEGVSQGRYPDGTTTIVSFIGSASPGASNYVLNYTGPVVNEVLARNSALYGPFGNTPDFVEIYNPTAGSFNLGGFGLSDEGDKIKFQFAPGTTIASAGYLVVWCDSGKPKLTNATPFNASFSLSGSGGAIYLFNPAGQPVSSVDYGSQVEDMPIGLSGGQWRLLAGPTPGAANAGPAALGSISNLAINEWMADASNGGDDWFEIYNRDSLPVAMAGLFLTDDPSVAGNSNDVVAALSFIAGNGWVKFVADGNRGAGHDHVSFSLDGGGETLRIYAPNLSIIDNISFATQTNGISQGRLPDGGSNIVSFAATPTPGAANYIPHANIVVNEVLIHTDPPLEDAIELQNVGPTSVDIGNWWISNTERNFRKFHVPAGTIVPPGQFAVFYENQFNPDGTGTAPSFTLNSAHGDSVYVSTTDAGGNLTGYRAQVSFGPAENGVSLGRFATSTGTEFTALAQRTFGTDNPSTVAQFRTGSGKTNAYAKVGPIVINEINYHPISALSLTENPDEEFVELFNASAASVPLFDPLHPTNTWAVAGGISFRFPTNVTLGAGGYLILVDFDPTANSTALASFRARYGNNGTVLGPFSGRLANDADVVELYKPDAPQVAPHPDAGFVPSILVDRVAYADNVPWPTAADGGGASLQRISAVAYGNDPANWKAEAANAGRTNSNAGGSAPFISDQPDDLTIVLGGTAVFAVTASGTPAPAYQWQHAGTNLTGQTSATLTLTNVQAADGGVYHVLISNIAGSIVSADVTLTVVTPPSISVPPQNITAVAGTPAQLSVTAAGTGPLHFQWRKSGSDIVGANNPQFSFTILEAADAGFYSVVITNVAGSITSSVVLVTVIVPPSITADPVDATVLVNSPVSFTVSATGTAPLFYQWRKDGVNISGATASTLSFGSAQTGDEGLYSCLVTNAGGFELSDAARLVVSVAPVLAPPHPIGDGSFVITVGGETNRSYTIDWSANLTTWSNLGTITLTNTSATLRDTSAPNATVRFYRARTQ